MRSDSAEFSVHNTNTSKKPRYVVRISFDNDNTDFVYFTSHTNTETPSSATVINNVLRGISGISQKINPDQGNSTIGGFSFKLVDRNDEITEKLRDKLNAGDGLRHKRIVCYVGFEGNDWDDYQEILTYIIDGITYKDGEYLFKCSDIQRIIRKDIFEPEKTTLAKTVNSYQGHIPATIGDVTKFPTVYHDSSYSDRPNTDVGYILIKDEVIAHEGLFTHAVDGVSFKVFAENEGSHITANNSPNLIVTGTPFVVDEFVGKYIENFTDNSIGLITANTTSTITATLAGGTDNDWDIGDAYRIIDGRGALNSKAVEHVVDSGTSADRREKITEHVFLAGAAPKVAYQIMTGHVAENLVSNSNAAAGGSWVDVGGTTDSDVDVDSAGGNGMDRYNIDTSGVIHHIYNTESYITSADTNACFSKFLKYDGAQFVYLGYRDSSVNYIWMIIDMTTHEIVNTISSGLSVINQGIVYKGSIIRAYISIKTVSSSWTLPAAGVTDSADPTIVNGYPNHTATLGHDFLHWGSQVTKTNYLTPYFETGSTNQEQKTLPDNWNLGIDLDLVKIEDYTNIGNDLWNQFDDSGRHVRFEGTKKTDGKKFIEKEIMYWLASFMPIYADGKIGLKRLSPILSDSSYIVELNDSNVVNYSQLSNDYKSVINQITIDWNYNFQRDEFTKTSVLIDADSVSKHNESDIKKIELLGIHTASHTDEDILSYFDSMRDRYSGAPLRLSVTVLPSLNTLEVGDVVKLTLDQIRDFNVASGTTIDRAFEVQQVSTDWITGNVRLNLFGSSQKAGTLERTTLNNVLSDDFYTSAGTELSTVLTISGNTVTADDSLTGGETMAEGIYYYEGNLTIGAGVTVDISDNVELRIEGHLTINGTINGVGGGLAGGAGGSLWLANGSTSITSNYYEKTNEISGAIGYLGTTQSQSGIITRSDLPFNVMWNRSASDIAASNPSVPFFNIVNNLTSIVGAPADLRGTSGGGGGVVVGDNGTFSSRDIVANGGAGGAGGAGLVIVSRGLSFGVSGLIDTSGAAGSAGGTYTSLVGHTLHAGSGGAGAAGGLAILMDGNHTPPELTNTHTARYGDTVIFGELVGYKFLDKPVGHYSSKEVGIFGYDMGASAYTLQYIPPSEIVEEEINPPPPDVETFTSEDDGMYLKLAWGIILNTAVISHYEIREGTVWDTSPIVGTTPSYELNVLPESAGTYYYMIKAVGEDGQYSVNENSGTFVANPEVPFSSNLPSTTGYNNTNFFWRAMYDSLDIYDAANATIAFGSSITVTGSAINLAHAWRKHVDAIVDISLFDSIWRFKSKLNLTNASSVSGYVYCAIGSTNRVGIFMVWNGTTSKIDVYGRHKTTNTLIISVNDGTDIDFEVVVEPDVSVSYTANGTTVVSTTGVVASTDITDSFIQSLHISSAGSTAPILTVGEWMVVKE